ncbi:MAG: Card1-like endonuclease domain-containing protein [Gammaproteobacteria bacterium]
MDVAFLALNRLFVIWCKAARMGNPEAPKANDTLYKFSEIKNPVGGLGTRGLLASYRALRGAENAWRQFWESNWSVGMI